VSFELWRPLAQVTSTAASSSVWRDARRQVAAAPCFKEQGFRIESLHTREIEGVEYALVAGELG
jgi:hypothetical protein